MNVPDLPASPKYMSSSCLHFRRRVPAVLSQSTAVSHIALLLRRLFPGRFQARCSPWRPSKPRARRGRPCHSSTCGERGLNRGLPSGRSPSSSRRDQQQFLATSSPWSRRRLAPSVLQFKLTYSRGQARLRLLERLNRQPTRRAPVLEERRFDRFARELKQVFPHYHPTVVFKLASSRDNPGPISQSM